MSDPTTSTDISEAVRVSLEDCPDERLRKLLSLLVTHLHRFAIDVGLTQSEWEAGIQFLTEVGEATGEQRQEFVLSDTLGPFWVAGSPQRQYGESITEQPGGQPVLVS